MSTSTKRRRVSWFHRRIANPVMRPLAGHVPGNALLETTGRRTGLPRRTPIGGRRVDQTFWLVSDHGRESHYVRNLIADPRVRVRIRSRWYRGVAEIMPGDDARRRLRSLPWFNSMLVRVLGTDLLTIRIRLDL
ncbi:nitroreductase/quinone reductase family protein [Nocardia sp. NPDC048505]|uniref:nitroreductase/quinone reductase family protein n=1 Tax=unclassified Nocardia TaxID=2637762 RepID=UPI0033E831A7